MELYQKNQSLSEMLVGAVSLPPDIRETANLAQEINFVQHEFSTWFFFVRSTYFVTN